MMLCQSIFFLGQWNIIFRHLLVFHKNKLSKDTLLDQMELECGQLVYTHINEAGYQGSEDTNEKHHNPTGNLHLQQMLQPKPHSFYTTAITITSGACDLSSSTFMFALAAYTAMLWLNSLAHVHKTFINACIHLHLLFFSLPL